MLRVTPWFQRSAPWSARRLEMVDLTVRALRGTGRSQRRGDTRACARWKMMCFPTSETNLVRGGREAGDASS